MDARFVSLRAALRVVQADLDDPVAHPNAAIDMNEPAGRIRTERLPGLYRAAGRSRCHRRALVALALAGAALSGCAWAGADGRKTQARPHVEPRDTRLVHEDCPVTGSGATAEDINGDGRPDRHSAFGTVGVRCRALDFDFDGRIDAWVYLEPGGQVRRRENDFDRDGIVDEISLYERGTLVEQQRSTSQPGKLDTWHYFRGGRLARTERDANGDDYIDQWWEYPDQRSSECPLIHSDVDGDGKPDRRATVDVCREREPDVASSEPAPPLGVDEVPTQIETPAEPAPGSPAASPPARGATP